MANEKKNKILFNQNTILLVLVGVMGLLMLYMQFQISDLSNEITLLNENGVSVVATESSGSSTTAGTSSSSGSSTSSAASLTYDDIKPAGTPEVYGSELGVSFDSVQASINVMAPLDNQISLSGDELDRYIDIGLDISCEYCCGAKAVINSNGQAACGCAHSYSMRGLAKYLISEHGDEYTNDEILEELGKWKVTFFPKNTLQKAVLLSANDIELSYVNIASNKYKDTSELIQKAQEQGVTDLPEMVGGC